MDEGDTVTITLTVDGLTDGQFVTAITQFAGGTAIAGTDFRAAGGGATTTQFSQGTITARGNLFRTQVFAVTADSQPEPDETIVLPVPRVNTAHSFHSTTDTFAYGDPLTVTIRQNDGYVAPVAPPVVTPGPAPGPATDNPAALAERLEAPVGAVARGIGMLAVEAVTKRARSVATTNQFHLGQGATAEELLRRSSFNLAGGGAGVRGVSIWGSGGYVSADGDHKGVDYDGDTSAFHIGGDTQWRDGLIGMAVARSDGDVDFTVTADGMKSTLETTVTSVHPYLTRRINGSQFWLTAGYGAGDAELKEPGTVIKTDVTITTAAFGINNRRGDLFTAGLSALFSRAELDAAVGDGKTLPATTADTVRITASGEAGWTHGAWRPFLNFALRHDSGDGNTGGAADLGGGVEWQTPTVLVRLAGSGHIQGQATDEQRATLTVRKSTGNFDLNLNLAADPTGIDTARLLHGEWRF